MTRSPLLSLCLTLALAGCSPAMVTIPPVYSDDDESPHRLESLVTAASHEELEKNLRTPLQFSFPVRVGVLFYDYSPVLTDEDQEAALAAARQSLVSGGRIRSLVHIPTALVGQQDSLDAIRRIAARFEVDTLLIVSGKHTIDQARNRPVSFLDTFSNRVHLEAQASLTALGVDVLTGRFLPPFTSVGKAGPTLLDPDARDYRDHYYGLQKAAADQAFAQVQADFAAALSQVAAAPSTDAQ